MNVDTAVFRDMVATETSRAYDASVKRILSNKPFLARIMKECMAEYRDCSVDDIINLYIEGEPQVGIVGVDVDETNPRITGLNTEDRTLTEGTVFYDIRYTALAPKEPEPIRIIINIEAQNKSNPHYSLLKRAIYYCSRMISAQKGSVFSHSDYDKIRKVYSVWICTNVPGTERNTITAYAMKETPMVGNVTKNPEEYDLLSVIMICLGDGDMLEDGVLGMLKLLLKGSWTTAQRKNLLETSYGIPMTERLEKEVSQMCNLSQGVFENAWTKGMKEGMKEGMEKGMEKGVEHAQINSIRSLMTTLKLPLSQAMDALEIPADDRPRYEQLINA